MNANVCIFVFHVLLKSMTTDKCAASVPLGHLKILIFP